jgi:hypothetical protein
MCRAPHDEITPQQGVTEEDVGQGLVFPGPQHPLGRNRAMDSRAMDSRAMDNKAVAKRAETTVVALHGQQAEAMVKDSGRSFSKRHTQVTTDNPISSLTSSNKT